MPLIFRKAMAADRHAIEQLLTATGLTTAGVPKHLSGFEVAEDGGCIVGSAGLEMYGAAALLRSVVVAPGHRSRGIARELVARLLHRAAQARVSDVYLLTTTAMDYFRKFGFEPIARTEVTPAVRASEEFGDACCETAAAMRKTIVHAVAGE